MSTRQSPQIARLLRDIKGALLPLADPVKARGAEAYMRDQFPMLGIPTPMRRAALVPILKSFRPEDAGALLHAAQALWQMRERDYQAAAVDLLAMYQKRLSAAEVPALLTLVQEKSWWDSVDSLAKVIGAVVRRDKAAGQPQVDEALAHADFWVRRVAMLHQLGWRAETDTRRLFSYADRLAPETEFFIRKAIGWALRDYAWHDPAAVEAYLRRNRAALSPLTLREAGKHLSIAGPSRSR